MGKSIYRRAAEIVHKYNIFSCTAIANTKKVTGNYDAYYVNHLKKIRSYEYYFSHISDSCIDNTWWNKSPDSYDNRLCRTLALLLMDEIIKTEGYKNECF